MRTVKEVAKLTGISVRTLQYYDEIGVLKPARVTAAGYRLYDDKDLKTLQQVLFFKELDFPLKNIKEIMSDPDFNKIEAFKKQKQLLKAKRDRLNGLLELIDKLEKGESCMSFKEFNLSEYLKVLDQFKTDNKQDVIKYWGSIEEFDEFIGKIKEDETHLAEIAVKQYGSIEKYTEAMKESLDHFSENMEKLESIKANGYLEKNKSLTEKLVQDITKDVNSQEVQAIVKELISLGEETRPNVDMGQNYWDMVIDAYLNNANIIRGMDSQYKEGTSEFIGKALQYYFENNEK